MTELAEAIGDDVWLVSSELVIKEYLPSPTNVALANVVLRARSFGAPAQREALVRRLTSQLEEGNVALAIRRLLAGHPSNDEGQDCRMFYAPNRQ